MFKKKKNLENELLNLFKKHEKELGIWRGMGELGSYTHLLSDVAKELGYEFKDRDVYEKFSDRLPQPNIAPDKVIIPVKRKYGLPHGKLSIKFQIPVTLYCGMWYREEDEISVPFFVDEKDAFSKLNDFLQKASDCCKKYPEIYETRPASEDKK